MVRIIRIIKDGKVLEESDNIHYIGEKLIIFDKETKYLDITIEKVKKGKASDDLKQELIAGYEKEKEELHRKLNEQ